MHKIKAKELSREAFDKYGVYQNLLDSRSLATKSVFSEGFFADVVAMDFALSLIHIFH